MKAFSKKRVFRFLSRKRQYKPRNITESIFALYNGRIKFIIQYWCSE